MVRHPAPEDEYAGASLRYVRHLLGAPARWPSATVAAEALHPHRDSPPPLFSVVFFGSVPHGHCGLYVGRHQALTMDRDGWPRLLGILATDRWGGEYLGWVDRESFILLSMEKTDG